MFKLLIIIFFSFNQINCLNDFNGEEFRQLPSKELEIGISQIYPIEYKKETNFIFKIEDDNIYQINIHSINCNFEIDFKGEIINQMNLDTYSLKMNKTNNNIIIKPLIDIVEGKEKENYDQEKCHLTINSMNMNQPEVKIENKEDSFFYFEKGNSYLLNISYEIKEISTNTFAALFFQFNEKCNFSIDIYNNNEGNPVNIKSNYIYNSTYIYLKSDILKNISNGFTKTNLTISIKKIDDNKAINMFFKVVEKETISMIKKGALNYGFITTEINYQFFYLEVFNEEEGELMLHNKRFYGELIAKIVTKDEINYNDIYNSSIYPKYNNDSKLLNYNPHSLKLIYRYKETSICTKGCYILITYEQKKSEIKNIKIGYEFTILSRSWNYSDFSSQIVDIPFGEYLLGAFDKESITHHYYSLSIPENAEKLIIQLEGNFIDFFLGEGRRKINTMYIKENDKKFQIIDNQNLIRINITELCYKENKISFAFRSKDYFADIFSFYYFRIFYAHNNEIIYFPMDSQLGNICAPENYNSNTNSFYCNFIFSNKYDELSTNFAVSSPNLNEYFKINVIKSDKNDNIINDEEFSELFYIYNNSANDINNFFFTFEFQNKEIKNVISALLVNINNYYPHIYSSQMFYLNQFNTTCLYKLKNRYTLIYKYIYGKLYYNGWVYVSYLNFRKFYSSRNFRGKPFALDINSKTNNITFGINSGDFLFVFSLEYNMQNKGIIEVKSGEARSQIIENGYFPLYYYLKIKDKNYINIDVNLRLNSFDSSVMKNNFDIKGYLLDEDTIKRKINGEYIKLTEPINGFYSNKFKIGLLELNREKKYEPNNYLLIEIQNIDSSFINSNLLVEIVSKEYYQDVYFMPIGSYIIETFDDKNNTIRDKNKYHIYANQRGESQILIELSPEYNDIDLNFTKNETSLETFKCSDFNCTLNYVTGFKKYQINEYDDYNIYFSVNNPKNRTANYMIRYYYSTVSQSYTYKLNDIIEKKYLDMNNDYITLSITFEQIQIYYHNELLNTTDDIYFYISGLLYYKNNASEELLNTTSILYEKKPKYENQTVILYNSTNPGNFTLTFKNILRKENYVYDLQIQTNVFIENNVFNEEFLIFTKEIDLTDIKLIEEKSILWYILGPVLGLIFLVLVIFFAIKFIRLKNSNINLQEDLKSMAYSNNVQKNVIAKDNEVARKDLDYDSTFI